MPIVAEIEQIAVAIAFWHQEPNFCRLGRRVFECAPTNFPHQYVTMDQNNRLGVRVSTKTDRQPISLVSVIWSDLTICSEPGRYSLVNPGLRAAVAILRSPVQPSNSLEYDRVTEKRHRNSKADPSVDHLTPG
jgi:hypothetical protein